MRASHTSVLPHLDFEGTRLTTLAERMEISKQAVGQLVEDLEQMDTVRREPDPTDGRAKLIRFTDVGLMQIFEGLDHLSKLERELNKVVGRRRLREARETLSAVLKYVEQQLDEAAEPPSTQ